MKILFVTLLLLVTGCASNGYQDFYTSYIDPKADPNLESLGENKEPQVFGTDDFKRDIRILRGKRYVVVGQSSFNGSYEDINNAVAQAKKIGATLVLSNSEYTNTQSSTSDLFIPNSQTTYHSGTVYGGSSSARYSGTSTTYGSTTVPVTTHQRRYDQSAFYFVKRTNELKLGVEVAELLPEERLEIGRNTGALIYVVMEGSKAFNSNVMEGDVLIAIDAKQVKNRDHAVKLFGEIPEGQSSIALTVIRKGEEKVIVVEF
jgi:serine protease Do